VALFSNDNIVLIRTLAIGMIHFMTSKTDLHETPFLKFNMDTVIVIPDADST
jgi:hypothetical protein